MIKTIAVNKTKLPETSPSVLLIEYTEYAIMMPLKLK